MFVSILCYVVCGGEAQAADPLGVRSLSRQPVKPRYCQVAMTDNADYLLDFTVFDGLAGRD